MQPQGRRRVDQREAPPIHVTSRPGLASPQPTALKRTGAGVTSSTPGRRAFSAVSTPSRHGDLVSRTPTTGPDATPTPGRGVSSAVGTSSRQGYVVLRSGQDTAPTPSRGLPSTVATSSRQGDVVSRTPTTKPDASPTLVRETSTRGIAAATPLRHRDVAERTPTTRQVTTSTFCQGASSRGIAPASPLSQGDAVSSAYKHRAATSTSSKESGTRVIASGGNGAAKTTRTLANKPGTQKDKPSTTKTTKTTTSKMTISQGDTPKTTKAGLIKTATSQGEANKTCQVATSKTTTSKDGASKTSKAVTKKPNPDAEKLVNLDSPFTWKLGDIEGQRSVPIMDFLRAKLEKKVEYRDQRHEGDAKWRVLVLNLVLCYESYKLGEKPRALSYVEECASLVTTCVTSLQEKGSKVTSSTSNLSNVTPSPDLPCSVTSSQDNVPGVTSLMDGGDLVVANKEAFSHILASCRYHLARTAEERKKVLSSLPPRAGLEDQVKAALLGIRAAVTMEYGPAATLAAVPLLEKAVNGDPSAFLWLFLLAKCLGRRRRADQYDAVNDVPYTTELSALETVVRLSKRPFHAAFLAGVCRGVASTLSAGEGTALLREVAKLNDRAVELYEQAALAAPDCALTNIRCAEGYMLLPMTSHQNMNRSYQLGKRALELAPDNTMINHIWGRVNEAMGFEEKALRYLKVAAEAGSFKANLDLLTLKAKRDKEYNPVPELEEMLQVFDASVHHQEICTQICSHCLLVLEDVPRAVGWCVRVVRLDPRSKKLTQHRPLGSPSEVNLYQELMTHALKASTEDQKGVFSDIITTCRVHYPELLNPAPSRTQLLYEKVKALTARTRLVAEETLSPKDRTESASSVGKPASGRGLNEEWRSSSGNPLNYERSWYWKERPGPRSETSCTNWHSFTSYRVRPCNASSQVADFSQIPPEIVWKINSLLPRFLNGQEI